MCMNMCGVFVVCVCVCVVCVSVLCVWCVCMCGVWCMCGVCVMCVFVVCVRVCVCVPFIHYFISTLSVASASPPHQCQRLRYLSCQHLSGKPVTASDGCKQCPDRIHQC